MHDFKQHLSLRPGHHSCVGQRISWGYRMGQIPPTLGRDVPSSWPLIPSSCPPPPGFSFMGPMRPRCLSLTGWLAGLTAGSQRRPWRERGKRKSSEGTCQTWMAPLLRHTPFSPSEFYLFQLRTNETQMTEFKISSGRGRARWGPKKIRHETNNIVCTMFLIQQQSVLGLWFVVGITIQISTRAYKKIPPKPQRLRFFLLLPTSAALGFLWFSCFVLDLHVHKSQGSCIMWLDLTGETFH